MNRHGFVLALSLLAQASAAIAHNPDETRARSVQVPDHRLSDLPCVRGRAGVFPCQNLNLLAFVPKSEFGIELSAVGGLSETWGWHDAVTGDEYIIQGVSNGVHFLRVNDPLNPEYLGTMPNTAAAQLVWYDMKVNDTWLYTVSESVPHHVRVFDLTQLRGASGSDNLFLDAGRYLPNQSAHNIVINEATDYAYVVGGNFGQGIRDECSGGLIALDLSNPILPLNAGCWDGDAYVHDSQCIVYNGPDTEHLGKEICLNSNGDNFSIVDFSDKAKPVRLGELNYQLTAYVHQGWISDDHRTFFLGDELDEQNYGINTRTLIVDLDDLDKPRLLKDFIHRTRATDHNMYVKDGLLYQSNYAAGLRILDTARAREGQLELLASFDTFPDHDEATFDGSWGNYPFLPSGTIAVSSGEEGLFLLRLNPAERDESPASAGRDTSVPARAGGVMGLASTALLILAFAARTRRRRQR